MGYLEEDEIRVSAPGSDNPECLSRHMFVIVCCEVGFLGPGCGHTALLPSVLQRSPELCHGGTMTTTLKQESENH